MTLVSVMMPVLDPDPVFFPQAVASVLGQTHQDVELVIIEAPGKRSAREMLPADPRVRHHANPQRTSLVDQRNQALEGARGEFVAMLDADDIAVPDRIAKQLAFLQAHPDVSLLGSQLTIIDSTGAVVGSRSYPTSHDDIVSAMTRYNAIAQPAVMARRAALVDAGGYQYRAYPVNEDYELWSRLVARGARLANHPEPLLRYRVHPSGTKAAMLKRMLRATIDVKRSYWRDRMDTRAKARLLAEYALLGLPPGVVYRLFMLTQYKRA